ncbi:MAG: permease-like cell division protein FtsX [Oscillospiraceae bacterium]|nr:permease-like cell division protein FtsX [Oscillospiraceae bacterium]
MKINNIGYLIKEGIRGIFLHGFMSFAAVCVTIACLLIVGSFSCLAYNFNIIVEDLNKTNEVMVYVDETLSDAQARSVGTRLNQVENIYNAQFVSREEALENFIADHEGDDAFVGVDAKDLRHRYVVTLEDNELIHQTVERIKKVEGVADVKANFELAEGFSALQNVLHVASIVVIAVLLMVSLLIISNTVKLAMYDRRDEIAIMKMVGATNGFIRLPFVVEGFTLGMVGAAISFGLMWLLYDWVVVQLDSVSTLKLLLSFVPFTELLVPMVVTFAAAGLFVGVIGSWTSIRKFMDV